MSEGMTEMDYLTKLSPLTLHKVFKEKFYNTKKIAKGGFSRVFKATSIEDGKEYAIKMVTIESDKSDKMIRREFQAVANEIRILSESQSKHVVKYFGSWAEIELKNDKKTNCKKGREVSEYDSFTEESCDEDSYINLRKDLKHHQSSLEIRIDQTTYNLSKIKAFNVYIKMEVCERTLLDYMKDTTTLPIEDIIRIFIDIVMSIEYLHTEAKIIHRDIKPSNVLISQLDQIKIGDFGLSTGFFDEKYKKFSVDYSDRYLESNETSDTVSYHTKNIGTLKYASPEQLKNNYYNYKTDIYSLGLILFELVYPMKTAMEKQQLFDDLKKLKKLPDKFWEKYPDYSQLIISMTDDSPCKRPNTKEILELLHNVCINNGCKIFNTGIHNDSNCII